MNSLTFPMSSTGRAGYAVPTTLEQAGEAIHNAQLQQRTNDVLKDATDTVEFLRCRDDQSGQTGIIDGVPRRNRDLNPEPGFVLISGSDLNFARQVQLESGASGGTALLRYDPKEDDALKSVEQMEVNQADGVRIRVRQDESGAQVIHFMDAHGDCTVVRDQRLGVLTLMYE